MKEDYHPSLIGQIATVEILEYIRSDGWNSDGKLRFDSKSSEATECTANCGKYVI